MCANVVMMDASPVFNVGTRKIFKKKNNNNNNDAKGCEPKTAVY